MSNHSNRPSPFKWIIAGVAVVAAVWWFRHGAGDGSHGSADISSVPTVAVVKVDRENLAQEVTIPAEFRPYVEVELHPEVSGYVKEMKVDFGDRVKAGDVLATLEIPDLQADLAHAEAAQKHAEADYFDAHLAYTRLNAVNTEHPDLVAQQELDAAHAQDTATAAAVAAAKADVEKYQAMVNYSRITAPFDGVITRRYADPGAFITAGTAANPDAKSLLHISDNYLLRLDFPVSVAYVKDMQLSSLVEVRVDSLGGKTYQGKITRFTDQVDDSTRTMMTEIEVPNQNLEIIPGMYATVVLKTEQHAQTLAVPVQAVTGEKNPMAYVVNQDHQLEERPVTLGLETPDKYEILSGLQEGDLVVIGNHPAAGQKVEPKLETAQAQL